MSDMQGKAAIGRHRRRSLHQWVMDVVGREWCGNSGPPLGNQSVYVYDDGLHRVFSMQDDGGFVGIGYPDEWQVIMRTRAARLFAWWTFKVWLADLCGLRTAVYYRALHRAVSGTWRLDYKRGRERAWTRWSSYDEWREGNERRSVPSK